ncbi:MAG: protein-glutamate O-methyltransferase CheR [Anaerotruncus sp.]|nr:protein-glutamate O-methyltransferase CheR [Anaerotruncus sp.]
MTDEEFATLTNFVKQKYGIDLTKKRTLIEGRLTNELRHRGFRSFKDYFNVLFNDKAGNETVTLLNKLTTNLSYFMRENEHFEFLRTQVLPYFERTRHRELRIWSAGCSTGQEPYNTAIVLDEYFGTRKSQWDTRILATDISMKVLTQAKAGIYTAEDLKDLPAQWKQKYFIKQADGRFQVCERIRKEVIFRPLNLMEPFHFKKPMDLIFCRNVMIYFDGPTKQQLVNKYYDWTAPGGYLFIGHSESIGNDTRYTYVQPAIYQKKG